MENEPRFNEFTESDLETEMEEWKQRNISNKGNSEDKFLESLTGLELFDQYKNNFAHNLFIACRFFNSDGAINEGQEEYVSSKENRRAEKGEKFADRDMRLVLSQNNVEEETISRLTKWGHKTEEDLLLLKKLYLELRSMGYSKIDLTR